MSKKLLNQPYNLKGLELKNHFVMAPLTRGRCDPKDGIPNDLMVKYYSQRAEHFGLLITECAQISDISTSFPGSGAIYNKAQAEGWKKVVDAVHSKGGKIIMQLWHCGRAVPKEYINNKTPVSSSAVAIRQNHYLLNQPHPVPKELSIEEIKDIIEQFRQSAIFAKEAGFDGVLLHGANGYLVDQFLRDGVNKRTDIYGGSVENRARFLFEVLDALISVYGSDRVSLRMSPTGRYNDNYDSNPLKLMEYVLPELSKKNLQFVELKRHGNAIDIVDENDEDKKLDKNGQVLPQYQIPKFFETLRKLYKGILVANDGFTPESAEEIIKKGNADLVSFGRLSINNPDLPVRYENGYAYNTDYDWSTFFVGNEKGYTDFLTYEEEQKLKQAQS